MLDSWSPRYMYVLAACTIYSSQSDLLHLSDLCTETPSLVTLPANHNLVLHHNRPQPPLPLPSFTAHPFAHNSQATFSLEFIKQRNPHYTAPEELAFLPLALTDLYQLILSAVEDLLFNDF